MVEGDIFKLKDGFHPNKQTTFFRNKQLTFLESKKNQLVFKSQCEHLESNVNILAKSFESGYVREAANH